MSQYPPAHHLVLIMLCCIRFVNGIVDPAQKRQFAVSVGSLAERLQLPLWFVELRHAGTHEYLPSLQVLRNGSRQVCKSISHKVVPTCC